VTLVEEITIRHDALLKNRRIVLVVDVNVTVLRFQVIGLRRAEGFVGNARLLLKLQGDRRVAAGEIDSERTGKGR
jgi:hypothetical protein